MEMTALVIFASKCIHYDIVLGAFRLPTMGLQWQSAHHFGTVHPDQRNVVKLLRMLFVEDLCDHARQDDTLFMTIFVYSASGYEGCLSRCFSVGGLIHTAKRNRLADKTFETPLLLNVNATDGFNPK